MLNYERNKNNTFNFTTINFTYFYVCNKTVEDIISKYFLERGVVFSPE